MDVFFEQIIKKRSTGLDVLKKVGLVVATMLVIFIVTMILPGIPNFIGQLFGTIGLFLAVGAIYGAYYVITGMNVEYEYILTNGELDIDKIIAQRKRKRLITVNTREFTEFGKYVHTQKYQEVKSTILACGAIDDPENYYAILDHSKFGKTMLIFTPNEKIINNAKQYIKRTATK